MGHHTKDKGDVAVGQVIADAVRVGIKACVPITEHLPFDVILVNSECQLRRVQVRYATAMGTRISVRLRSCYSWSGGCKIVTVDRTRIDAFAIYCPDTGQVYYIRCDEIPADRSSCVELCLRPQRKIIPKRLASHYVGASRLFAPVAQSDRAADF